MKTILALAVISGFMSETTGVVLVSGKDGPVRVNQADFDADQEKPSAERQYTKYSGKETAEKSRGGVTVNDAVQIATPGTPDYSGGKTVAPLPTDPNTGAVVPTTASPNSRLVMPEGKKFFIVDGMGQKIKGVEGIDEDGYSSQKAANDAIKALPR